MLNKTTTRRNAFYRKALVTSKQTNLRFVDVIDLYFRMADSKRIRRLEKRYGSTTQWDKAEYKRDGFPWISVPILLHVKNEIIGWRMFLDIADFNNDSDKPANIMLNEEGCIERIDIHNTNVL